MARRWKPRKGGPPWPPRSSAARGFDVASILRHPNLRRHTMTTKPAMLLLLTLSIQVPGFGARSGAPQSSPADQPFVMEYYYKARWGYADEFIRLFKKNHYPILKKQVESGRFLQVTAVRPRYHATEDGRWDYRVTIVFKNASVANDSSGEDAII